MQGVLLLQQIDFLKMRFCISEFNDFSWFEQYVSNLDKARVFYERVFEKSLGPVFNFEGQRMLSFDNFSTFDAKGVLVEVPSYSGESMFNGRHMVYFECDDCALEESKIECNGGLIVKSKHSIGEYGFLAIVKDIDRNSIGLHSLQ